MAVAVISASGKKLMPTNNAKARKLLKKGRAVIYKYRPVFTIRLLDRTDGKTQPVEYKCDTGYAHIGIKYQKGKPYCADKEPQSDRVIMCMQAAESCRLQVPKIWESS